MPIFPSYPSLSHNHSTSPTTSLSPNHDASTSTADTNGTATAKSKKSSKPAASSFESHDPPTPSSKRARISAAAERGMGSANGKLLVAEFERITANDPGFGAGDRTKFASASGSGPASPAGSGAMSSAEGNGKRKFKDEGRKVWKRSAAEMETDDTSARDEQRAGTAVLQDAMEVDDLDDRIMRRKKGKSKSRGSLADTDVDPSSVPSTSTSVSIPSFPSPAISVPSPPEDSGEWEFVKTRKLKANQRALVSTAGTELAIDQSPSRTGPVAELMGPPTIGVTTPEASSLEKRKKKKKGLEGDKLPRPEFNFDTKGFKNRTIMVKDVREVVLHLLSDDPPTNWLLVRNKASIQRVVVVLVPGILPSTLGTAPPSGSLPFSIQAGPSGSSSSLPQDCHLPIFRTLFSHACPTKAPGEKTKLHSAYQAFINTPLSESEKRRREKSRAEARKSDISDPAAYLLPMEMMREHGYPEVSYVPNLRLRTVLPRKSTDAGDDGWEEWIRHDEKGWIETPMDKREGLGQKMKVLGLDCEMCQTEDGHELARITVVDDTGQCIYDELAKPEKPILDYLTRWSGITEAKLQDVTTRLIDVQRKLTKLIDYDTILIGHSLDCDLQVLKLAHPWVIDTSVLYQHPRGPPFKPSLKWLAQKWLGQNIQTADVAGALGHDSEEDARTCIQLLHKKLTEGETFGLFASGQETIFEKLGRGTKKRDAAVVDHGSPGQWHGSKAKTTVACTTDEEVVQGVLDNVGTHDLVFARLTDLSRASGWVQSSHRSAPTHSRTVSTAEVGTVSSTLDTVVDSNPVPPSTSPDNSPEARSAALANLNQHISRIHAGLPGNSAFVIFTGNGDPREMARLSAKRANFDRLWKSGGGATKMAALPPEEKWMEQDERDLETEVENCRMGLSFYCVKYKRD